MVIPTGEIGIEVENGTKSQLFLLRVLISIQAHWKGLKWAVQAEQMFVYLRGNEETDLNLVSNQHKE